MTKTKKKSSKEIHVKLVVDTSRVTQKNVEHTVEISDNNGGHDVKPHDSSTFLITAKPDQNIRFTIKSKDKSTGVFFTKFQHEFGDEGCMVPMPNLESSWSAKAAETRREVGENFSISFAVEGRDRIFVLDPEIEIDPGDPDNMHKSGKARR